jgi:hypothetical protein
MFWKGIQAAWRAFYRVLGIIGNQITLCFFWKGLAIEVGDLGDAVAFTALPLSHVNMVTMIYKSHGNMGFH